MRSCHRLLHSGWLRSLSDIGRSTMANDPTICVVLGPKKSSPYCSEYASGFSEPGALQLAAPLSPHNEGDVGQAPRQARRRVSVPRAPYGKGALLAGELAPFPPID